MLLLVGVLAFAAGYALKTNQQKILKALNTKKGEPQ